jgi:AcrR family transcriptional regulator
VTDVVDKKSGSTRHDIIRAAAREFALKPYSLVNVDDILAHADVTKGAMYTHFRSKNALARAIVDHRIELAAALVEDLQTPSSSGLETLIDVSYLVATGDISENLARASLNLLESVGRFDGFQAMILDRWVAGFAVIVRRAVEEGDVVHTSDPMAVSRLIVSTYLGLRQTSDLDEPKALFGDLEAAWMLVLPGFADPQRLDYLRAFIRRRSALAIRNTAPLVNGNL